MSTNHQPSNSLPPPIKQYIRYMNYGWQISNAQCTGIKQLRSRSNERTTKYTVNFSQIFSCSLSIRRLTTITPHTLRDTPNLYFHHLQHQLPPPSCLQTITLTYKNIGHTIIYKPFSPKALNFHFKLHTLMYFKIQELVTT